MSAKRIECQAEHEDSEMKRHSNRLPARLARAGFTMIELMAVIVILGILMAFLVPRLAGMGEVVEVRLTRSFLSTLGTAISAYEHEAGDYPPSAWQEEWGPAPNNVNLGSEALYVTLWGEDFGGTGIEEDRLGNSDDDQSVKSLTSFAAKDLFELNDLWGNPIAYFHRRDYDRGDLYTTFAPDTGELLDCEVKARVNPLTKSPYNSRKFQLISAGPNGVFGDEDDVTNFKRD